jgi:uncharacterized protein YbbK (DUF523 family)
MKPKGSKRIKIGVSSCLLGKRVRHDGGHKRHDYVVSRLSQEFELIALCPEVERGMGVPREAIQLEGATDSPRLVEVVSRSDLTDRTSAWCRERLSRPDIAELSGFVLKAKSPTCAISSAKLFVDGRQIASDRSGMFAVELMRTLPELPVIEETDLDDPVHRRQFRDAVLAYASRSKKR